MTCGDTLAFGSPEEVVTTTLDRWREGGAGQGRGEGGVADCFSEGPREPQTPKCDLPTRIPARDFAGRTAIRLEWFTATPFEKSPFTVKSSESGNSFIRVQNFISTLQPLLLGATRSTAAEFSHVDKY